MATLNIKDERVRELARSLAERRGTSMTGAIRSALEEALAAEIARRDADAVVARLEEISRRSAARPEPFLTDDDLYDTNGLPR
ncbi:type II toxin-antitoxin system VapB family antitoxin [Litorihabitans aurantiacus]|uniref:Transcription factor n=1 Tax=Litorihabitans aurantiacus TaxID=1930061 RepID=A0AA38CR07_9MICO|nr:type II toxin-antitoxin system VapB family antitoxin [Litorihabitans aurantiacus]GMA32663.1 hypothetical protein GCM10025875_26550 [Litorihabitans aurantiacus]